MIVLIRTISESSFRVRMVRSIVCTYLADHIEYLHHRQGFCTPLRLLNEPSVLLSASLVPTIGELDTLLIDSSLKYICNHDGDYQCTEVHN